MKNVFGIVAVLGLAAAANAQVVNGGFETGDLTGWGSLGASSGSLYGVTTFAPHTGDQAAYFGAVTTEPDAIFQDVPTITGQAYTLTFWLRNDGDGDNNFRALWNGAEILNTGADNFGYTEYNLAVVGGAGATSNLRFEAFDIPNYYFLDDVSISRVPAPGAAALLGLGGLLAARRRR